MADITSYALDKALLNGPALAKICKNVLPEQNDQLLLAKLQALVPNCPVHLSRVGDEWYRLGGIIDSNGNRIANNLIEWTERTYIEGGKNLQTLIAHAQKQKLIATRQTGNTLHFVVQTGDKAQDFIQIDIDKTHEIADRWLVGEQHPPEDLEEFIDPLEPTCVEAFYIGAARYTYRRKTDVSVFMDEINKYHSLAHPAQRFMEDWNRSSAGHKSVFCNDWIIRPFQHTGRFGEQIINVEIVNTQHKSLPYQESPTGKKGTALNNLLTRFDRQAGYPFAWFFYMVKGNLVSSSTGIAVVQDINEHFAYLPERDIAVLKDWVSEPYSV
ncbi:MAG: hypothetical protein Q7U57_20055 [Methylovulum sp.]|nr:hypothetical protein [Methylovulum sp.]